MEDNEDQRVLELLRELNNKTLAKVIDLKKELAEIKSLDGVSSQLSKLLRRSFEKTNARPGDANLEQQVIELNLRLQE
jgi:hypothetical protein